MVQRNSEAFGIQTGSPVTQQQSGVGYASPDANKFNTTHVIDMPGYDAPNVLLEAIVGAGKKVAEAAYQRSTTEAYLDGAMKAGLGKTEADLTDNIFTRDWAQAGFRDTMGRLAQADANSRLNADMARLREQSPEKFGEYLAERRAKLLPQMEGMSLEARKGMVGTMFTDERAAIKLHGAEHYKYIVEQQQKAIWAVTDEQGRGLDAARLSSPGKDATEAYTERSKAAWNSAYTNVFMNPNLPETERPAMLAGYARQMIAHDHQKVYEYMRDMVVTMPDGTTRPMLSTLDADTRADLAGQYRQSLERTASKRAFGFTMELAREQADWEDPTKPMATHDDFVGRLKGAFDQGLFGTGPGADEKVAGIYKAYMDASLKRHKDSPAAQMFVTGDNEMGLHLNITRQEATDAWLKKYGKEMDTPTAVGALVTQSLQTGWPEPMQAAAKLTMPAWAQLMTRNDMDPKNAQIVTNTLKAMEALPAGSREAYLQSFDDETKEMILLTVENLKTMGDGTAALMKSRAVLLEGKTGGKLTAAQRAERAKEDVQSVATLEPQGLWAQGKTLVRSLWSSDARADRVLTASEGVFEDPAIAADAQAISNAAVMEELNHVSRTNPHLGKDARLTLAKSNVAARAVKTKWGPVIAPRGQTLESFFGIKDPERVAQALEKMVPKRTADGRISFTVDGSGSLVFREIRKDRSHAASGVLNPQDVKAVVEDMRQGEAKRYSAVHGAGTVHSAKIGNTQFDVKYNGRNGLSLPEEWMYDLRARLIKHEGVKDTAYEDAGGQMNKATGKKVRTVGVGISDTNNFFPKLDAAGKITPQQASDSLRDASEAAARVGSRWAAVARKEQNRDAFQLFTELAYQGGGANSGSTAVVEAVRNRDPKQAVQALHKSMPYRMAHPERRKFYDNTLLAILKE